MLYIYWEDHILIVYYKFYDYIKRRKIKIKDIINDTRISSATLANLGANKSVTTDTIGKLCSYLKCQPSDIMEFEEKGVNNE